jgi:hypothetical protein
LNGTTFAFEREKKEADPLNFSLLYFIFLFPLKNLFNHSSMSGHFQPQCVVHFKEDAGT